MKQNRHSSHRDLTPLWNQTPRKLLVQIPTTFHQSPLSISHIAIWFSPLKLLWVFELEQRKNKHRKNE
ncbi:hypothetical protein CsatB_012032 [Cannabis sativa]